MKKFAEMISGMSDRELTKSWKIGRATCSVIALFLGLMGLVGILTVIGAQASGDSALDKFEVIATGWGSCLAAVNGLALLATLFCRKSKICWYSAVAVTVAALVYFIGSMGYFIWKAGECTAKNWKTVLAKLWENQEIRVVWFVLLTVAAIYLVLILLFIIFRKYKLNGRALPMEINKRSADYLEKQEVEIVSKLYRCNSRKICYGISCIVSLMLSIGGVVACNVCNSAWSGLLLFFALLGFVVTLLVWLFNLCRGGIIRHKLACPVPIFHKAVKTVVKNKPQAD
jgi:hypothetical protein